MPLMPPGSQTGVYYIPVGNLPWNTTWKKLKSHARNRQPDGSGLAIVEANVYPGPTSTSGWVSVQGLADFRKAVDHMNHSPMEDLPRAARTLQADGRNETHPVMLGEEATEFSSPERSRIRRQTTWQKPPQYTSTSYPQEVRGDWPHHNAASVATPTPMSPSVSEIPFYQPPSSQYGIAQPFSGFAPPGEYGNCTQPSMVLSSMPAPLPQQIFLFHAGQQPDQMIQMYTPHPPQMIAMPQSQPFIIPQPPVPQLHSSEPSRRVIKSEARKMIITGLPLTANRKEVEELVQSVSSTACPGPKPRHRNAPDGTRYYLQHLELPRHSNGTLKGHAFAVLESPSTAKRTIDALNGMHWQGRKLHARFAKEGVESSNRDSRHSKRSDASSGRSHSMYDVAISHTSDNRDIGREPYERRTMLEEPQYRYTGDNNVIEVDETPNTLSANIQIDYRGDACDWTHSSSLESTLKSEIFESSISSLSSEGENERRRRMLSDDSGSHTPVVADGSFSGKKCR